MGLFQREVEPVGVGDHSPQLERAADAVLGYLIAFLVLLATVKLWHLLRLNPKLHMITATLQRAWTDISGFLVVMTIMFLAYSIAVRTFPRLTSTLCWSFSKPVHFVK
ncbi:hypothetical protein XENOCAPTIV_000549 [Xenoophorus captivus]|uniref:Polycystin cation channel PKD1/PKD2 domain-containing protein n=1 Tax=Xenoophorus captivus TaxID=1517983 RepID=A0ABV0S6R5_9TELE